MSKQEDGLHKWAQYLIGKPMRILKTPGSPKSEAISYRLGERLNGAWFKLASGNEVYVMYKDLRKAEPICTTDTGAILIATFQNERVEAYLYAIPEFGETAHLLQWTDITTNDWEEELPTKAHGYLRMGELVQCFGNGHSMMRPIGEFLAEYPVESGKPQQS